MTPDVIADRISDLIREGVLAEGAQLVQEDLAKRFGVSRNPVREALRLLEARGLVDIRGGGGATVRVLSAEDVTELYSLRIALEPTIAPHIVDGATGRAVQSLQNLVDRMTGEDDVTAWMNLNFEFHRSLYRLAERPRTEQILLMLLTAVQPYSLRNIDDLGGKEQADAEHQAMVDAISGRDAPALATLLVSHFESAEQRLEQSYRGTP